MTDPRATKAITELRQRVTALTLDPEQVSAKHNYGSPLKAQVDDTIGSAMSTAAPFLTLAGRDDKALEKLPPQLLERVRDGAVGVSNVTTKLRRLNPDPVQAQSERTDVEATLNRERDNLTHAATALSILHAVAPQHDKLSELMQNVEAELERLRSARAEIDKQRHDATAALSAAQQAAETAGITSYVRRFRHEAQVHEKATHRWLCCSIALAVAVVVVAALSAIYPDQQDVALRPQMLGAKIVIISTLSFSLVLAVRMYRTERHNAVLNRHRQNALMTFLAFTNAPTIDDATKNAVLLQATQAIFSPQASGYLGGKADAPMPSNVIEVIRDAVRPGKPG